MRIISYNILDGGEGRADPLAEIIEAQHADVIALIEADNPDVVERIAARLKMEVITAPGHKHSVALLSRWPVLESANHALLRPNLSGCMLEATLNDAAGVSWTFGLVHLHPHATESAETKREDEVTELLDLFAPFRATNRPHLLLGDFNADSPVRMIHPAKVSPAAREAWQINGGHIPRRAIAKLLAAGYTDTMHAVKGRWGAQMGTFTTQFPGQRPDHIFTWGIDRDRLKDAWIERDRLARYASDHYPVGVEID